MTDVIIKSKFNTIWIFFKIIVYLCLEILTFYFLYPVDINFAGIPPMIDSEGMAEKSLPTKLLLATIVLSGIIAPPVIVDELHIQQYSPINIGVASFFTIFLLKSAI